MPAMHPHNIGRPNAAKYLDEALRYILGHDGIWNTTADDIAEYYIANHYDEVMHWIAGQKAWRAAGERAGSRPRTMDLVIPGADAGTF